MQNTATIFVFDNSYMLRCEQERNFDIYVYWALVGQYLNICKSDSVMLCI